ncbi:MAG: hypothetical protein AAGF12_07395 [Myxococcota bacterium]
MLHHTAPFSVLLSPVLLLGACGGTTPDPVIPTGEMASLSLDEPQRGTTVDAGADFELSCGDTAEAGDQRFLFVAPDNEAYRFELDSDYDAVLAVRRVNDAELGCNDDDEGEKRRSALVVALRQNEIYEVIVDGFQGDEGEYELSVALASAAPPVEGQGRLTLGTPVNDTTANASDHRTPSCGSAAGSNDHVWQFVPETAGAYRFRVSAQYDSVVALFDAAGNELDCNDDQQQVSESEIVVRLEAGESYSVIVDGYQDANGAYRLVADRAPGPGPNPGPNPNPNPPPTTGGVVQAGTPVQGSTVGAGDSHTPTCGSPAGGGDNVWEFTPTQTTSFVVHVSAQYDSVVAVVDDRGVELACNDDESATSESEVIVGLQAGRVYRVVVDGYNGAVGTYQLSVQDRTAAAPAAPAVLTPAGQVRFRQTINDNTTGSTDQFTPSCGAQPATPDDVWEFTPPRTRTYRLHLASQYDSVLAVFDANRNEVDCNDDHRSTRESQVETRLTRGQTYYVVVDGYQGATGAYTLNISRPRKPGRP